MAYILSLDAGTSNSRALIVNKQGDIVALEQQAFAQHFPHHGWVEHDPNEIWTSQCGVIQRLLSKAKIEQAEIKALGITNQRETTIVWERASSRPIWNAIVWSDRRTKEWCDERSAAHNSKIYEKTGLYLESYFSATKIAWILDNVSGARTRAERGELCFGTVDTWLLWNLTQGKVFATDVSNASRTLLFNIHTLSWDQELLDFFNIPRAMLPEVKSSSGAYGMTDPAFFSFPIPITAVIGDQQASLFGHACYNSGDVKCTFGTGSFMLMHTGLAPAITRHRLLSTVAWKIGDEPVEYALEGVVYAAGAVVRWLQESMGFIKTPKEIEGLAYSVPDTNGVFFVTALAGLASPYWNAHVKGMVLGITPGTNIGHIARATLEGIVHQVTEVLDTMQKDLGKELTFVKCGGGMSENLFLMQRLADFTGAPIARSKNKEVTALGAAYLAGLAIGFWKDKKEIAHLWRCDRKFAPEMDKAMAQREKKKWKAAVACAELWAKEGGDAS